MQVVWRPGLELNQRSPKLCELGAYPFCHLAQKNKAAPPWGRKSGAAMKAITPNQCRAWQAVKSSLIRKQLTPRPGLLYLSLTSPVQPIGGAIPRASRGRALTTSTRKPPRSSCDPKRGGFLSPRALKSPGSLPNLSIPRQSSRPCLKDGTKWFAFIVQSLMVQRQCDGACSAVPLF